MPATYDSIATTTVVTPTSTINLTSIPGTYTDLVLIAVARHSAGGFPLLINFNNGNVSGWSRTGLQANGSAVSTYTSVDALGGVSLGDLGFNQPSFHKIDIFSYTNTSHTKTFLVNQNSDQNGNGLAISFVGNFPSTSAITEINLYTTNGNFAAGSVFSLYGILRA